MTARNDTTQRTAGPLNRIEDVKPRHAVIALGALNRAGEMAWQAFFAGLGWPEGAHYCRNAEYVRLTAAPMLANRHAKNVYWLYNRLVTP